MAPILETRSDHGVHWTTGRIVGAVLGISGMIALILSMILFSRRRHHARSVAHQPEMRSHTLARGSGDSRRSFAACVPSPTSFENKNMVGFAPPPAYIWQDKHSATEPPSSSPTDAKTVESPPPPNGTKTESPPQYSPPPGPPLQIYSQGSTEKDDNYVGHLGLRTSSC